MAATSSRARRGWDTLDFNGADGDEQMSLTPNGSRSLFLRTQGNIRMDMDGVEKLDLTALAGVDTITLDDMSGTDFRGRRSTSRHRPVVLTVRPIS